jgi:hypothetical protein
MKVSPKTAFKKRGYRRGPGDNLGKNLLHTDRQVAEEQDVEGGRVILEDDPT